MHGGASGAGTLAGAHSWFMLAPKLKYGFIVRPAVHSRRAEVEIAACYDVTGDFSPSFHCKH